MICPAPGRSPAAKALASRPKIRRTSSIPTARALRRRLDAARRLLTQQGAKGAVFEPQQRRVLTARVELEQVLEGRLAALQIRWAAAVEQRSQADAELLRLGDALTLQLDRVTVRARAGAGDEEQRSREQPQPSRRSLGAPFPRGHHGAVGFVQADSRQRQQYGLGARIGAVRHGARGARRGG